MTPEPISSLSSSSLAVRWGLSCQLASKLVLLDELFHQQTAHHLEIFSGYRSAELQRQLSGRGRPAAAVDLSNHTTCPANAADVRPRGVFPALVFKKRLGMIAESIGLRWGGGAPRDRDGIPVRGEWAHVDLGPRASA